MRKRVTFVEQLKKETRLNNGHVLTRSAEYSQRGTDGVEYLPSEPAREAFRGKHGNVSSGGQHMKTIHVPKSMMAAPFLQASILVSKYLASFLPKGNGSGIIFTEHLSFVSKLALRSVNSAHSAYACFLFSPMFFQKYNWVQSRAIQINTPNDRVKIQFFCRHGISKTHNLCFQESEALQAVFASHLCPNVLKAPARSHEDYVHRDVSTPRRVRLLSDRSGVGYNLLSQGAQVEDMILEASVVLSTLIDSEIRGPSQPAETLTVAPRTPTRCADVVPESPGEADCRKAAVLAGMELICSLLFRAMSPELGEGLPVLACCSDEEEAEEEDVMMTRRSPTL
ncbi:hypothetical protein F7725_012420 [Dissostichus mawsoni]|uniref:Uncharacterized protein n=1 Tax=Dissostichus mawsoni TaxID=36200 RepID=A0A7J5YQT7_DISMA|nr:hypothetical protein F7725_012420 [Dissostichus mawsoni]